MSKPMLVTWPFVLLLLDYWPLGRFTGRVRGLLLEKIPFFVLAAAAGVVTFWCSSARGGGDGGSCPWPPAAGMPWFLTAATSANCFGRRTWPFFIRTP